MTAIIGVVCIMVATSGKSVLKPPSSDKQRLIRVLTLDVDASPVALTSVQKIYDYARNVLNRKDVRRRDVEKFVRTDTRAMQLLRESRVAKKKTLTYRAEGVDLVWQLDLVDLHRTKGKRGAYGFLLTCIDVFSRRADAEPVYDKSATKVVRAFESICRRRGRNPVRVHTDEGKEFFNKYFAKFCKEREIHHYKVNSPTKAALVERFNRSIQNLLARYAKVYPKRKLTELLRLAVKNYNDMPHAVLEGYTPNDVTFDDRAASNLMWANLRWNKALARETARRTKPYSFRVGQTVRTTKERKIFSKGYWGFYTEEVFVVSRRFRRWPHLDINLYALEDLIGRPIENSIYYEHELQRVELAGEKEV